MWLLITLWIVLYVICTPLSLFVIAKTQKYLGADDLFVTVCLGLFPFVSLLILFGLITITGSSIIVWRKK